MELKNQAKSRLHRFLSHFQVPEPKRNDIISCFVLVLMIDQSIDNISYGRKYFAREH